MKSVVIYKSVYGYTKQYAKWIAEELSAELVEQSKFKTQDFEKYDTIIFGGGLYAGGISGINLIVKNFEKIKGKKVVVFTVGLADTKNDDNIKGINKGISKVFDEEMINNIKLFYLRGGIDYSKLNFVHKTMMAMLKAMILKKDKNSITYEDKQILETYGKVVDFTDKSTIVPLTEFCKS